MGQRARRSYLAQIEDSGQEYNNDELEAAVKASVQERMDSLLEQGVFENKAGTP